MNKYIFNWNAVLAHCPEYKEYLVDVKSLGGVVNEIMPELPEVRELDAFHTRTPEELEVMQQMNSDAKVFHGNVYVKAENSPTINYTLNPIYKNQPLPAKMNPLQLLPPKCVLGVGSEMFFSGKTGWHMGYQISSNMHKDGSVDLIKTKVNDKGDKIQLAKAVYWFNQNENVMSDRKGRFKCLTYNKKTRNLYYTHRRLKNNAARGICKRYKSQVSGILLNTMTLQSATSNIGKTMLKSFINLVEKAVLKDVPDAYIPTHEVPKLREKDSESKYQISVDVKLLTVVKENEFLRHKLLILILQHKANTRLDWLDQTVLNNIGRLVGANALEEQVLGINKMQSLGMVEYNKYLKNEHVRRVRKVVPSLRTNKSLKGLTKAVCGEFYAKILIKLMGVDTNIQKWIDVMTSLHYKRMPKFLYHWLSSILRDGTEDKERIKAVVSEALKTLSDLNSNNKREHTRTLTVLELWVKTCKRFLEQDGFIVTWYTWKDMYNMADRMNIRLRPNKFIDSDDVKRQHDLFSEFTNRDRSMLIDYANVVFREFAIPDKKYGGFTFVQLRTVEELVHEGTTMHHCVGGYAGNCTQGSSILFSMRKGDRGYVTVELNGTSMPYNVRQQYTIDDICVTNELVLELINKWVEDIRELHKEDTTTYGQKCQNVADALRAKQQLTKLAKLKDKATGDTLTHINNKCNELEQRLAAFEMESAISDIRTAEAPDDELPLIDDEDEIREAINVLRGMEVVNA